MATLTTTIGAAVTPAVGDFEVQVSGGACVLERNNTGSAAWVPVGQIGGGAPGAVIVSNPVASTQWRLTAINGTSPTISVDQ